MIFRPFCGPLVGLEELRVAHPHQEYFDILRICLCFEEEGRPIVGRGNHLPYLSAMASKVIRGCGKRLDDLVAVNEDCAIVDDKVRKDEARVHVAEVGLS